MEDEMDQGAMQLVELIVDDGLGDDPLRAAPLELWVTEDVVLRVPMDIDEVLLRALVQVICQCS